MTEQSHNVKVGQSGLPIEDETFALEWLTNGYDEKKAYKHINPEATDAVCRTQGKRKLDKPNIAAFIEGRIAEKLKQYNVTEQRIIEELASIAFLDAGDFFVTVPEKVVVDNKETIVWQSALRYLHEMPERARRAISSVSQTSTGEIKVKPCSKEKALELLARHKKMLTDRLDVHSEGDLADAIAKARERADEVESEEMLK